MEDKTKAIKILILVIGLIVGVISAYAAENNDDPEKRPFQITFIHPIGTNGIKSQEVINQVSINILGGVQGGLDGVEIGTLFNIDLGDVNGVQVSGLLNTVYGTTKGVQASGLVNYNKGNSTALQFSGITNVNIGQTKRGQFAGLANISTEETSAPQFAGLANVSIKEFNSVQVAGLVNTTVKDSRGLQLAGLVNVAVENHKGSQIAGLVNYTNRLNGLQLSFINVADTVEKGIPIGFFSFVTQGYRRIELEVNETLYANLAFKTGTLRFYNVFGIGYRPLNDELNWGVTYGLGTLKPLSPRMALNFELSATHLNEGEAWTDNLNLLSKFKVNASYGFGPRMEVFGGGSFNVATSRLVDEEGNISGSRLIPSYSFFNENINGTNVQMFFGLNAGLRF